MSSVTILGKPIRFVGTAAWNAQYGGLEGVLYIREALKCLAKHPVDMLVFEQPREGVMHIRSAGYRLDGTGGLDQTTVLFKTESLEIKKFFFKIDGDEEGVGYVGTFLFPDEH